MAEVFLCRTGQLTAPARRELKRAGIVVVEVEDPAACQFIRSGIPVSSDDMLWAACDALKVSSSARQGFADNMIYLVEDARQRRGAS